MANSDHFVRRLIEDSPGEVIGLSSWLAVSNCTHLHLFFFHASDNSLLMSAHVYTTLASLVSIH